MSNFSKSSNCPDSHTLLSFQNGDIAVSESAELRRHLAKCEFCCAEVQFYERYPQSEDALEKVEVEEMPRPLYELAEALIGGKRDLKSLEKLVSEINAASNESK